MQTIKPRLAPSPADLPTLEAGQSPSLLQIVPRHAIRRPASEEPLRSRLLEQRLPGAAGAADATHIATALAGTWHALQVALVPILGQRGVAALYKRSVQLTSATCPWLAGTGDGEQTPLDLAALQVAVSRQPQDIAADAGESLLQAVHALLVSLVGSSLTASLLRHVWNTEPATPGQPSP